jgi:site-specific recombinase XerD
VKFYHDSAGGFLRSTPDAAVDRISEFVSPYFLALTERELSDATRHTYWRGIRVFMRFLHAEGYVDQPIKLPTLRPPQTTIKPLSVDQVRTILRAFDSDRFTDIRNRTHIQLLIDTGLRLSESTGIEMNDLQLDDGFILIRGKGNKERWVPFGKTTKQALWRYIKQRAPLVHASAVSLFVTQEGQPLTARGFQMVLKRLSKKIDLKGVRLSPHTLRHSFALQYIEAGGDPFSLQRILGHSTQAMTAKYINMARSNVKAQHERFSPGDRI